MLSIVLAASLGGTPATIDIAAAERRLSVLVAGEGLCAGRVSTRQYLDAAETRQALKEMMLDMPGGRKAVDAAELHGVNGTYALIGPLAKSEILCREYRRILSR